MGEFMRGLMADSAKREVSLRKLQNAIVLRAEFVVGWSASNV